MLSSQELEAIYIFMTFFSFSKNKIAYFVFLAKLLIYHYKNKLLGDTIFPTISMMELQNKVV